MWIRDLGDESLAREWDELVDRAGETPFVRPGWAAAWWHAFGSGRPQVLSIRRQGELVAILPLRERRGQVATLTNWHTPDFSFLTVDDDAASELAGALFDSGPRCVTLAFLNPAKAGVSASRDSAEDGRYRILFDTLERPPYVAIEGTWEAYVSGLKSKLLQDLRRRRRLLEKEGKVWLHVADGSEGLEGLLEEGFRIEASGWKGEQRTAIASRPETRSFYGEIARWAADRGWLRLAFLRLDERPVAFQFAIEDQGIYYFLKGGYDVGYQRFAPGRLLVRDMIEWSFSKRLDRFDFGGAAEPFKLEWTNDFRELVRLRAFAPSFLGTGRWAAFAYGRPLAIRMLRRLGR